MYARKPNFLNDLGLALASSLGCRSGRGAGRVLLLKVGPVWSHVQVLGLACLPGFPAAKSCTSPGRCRGTHVVKFAQHSCNDLQSLGFFFLGGNIPTE